MNEPTLILPMEIIASAPVGHNYDPRLLSQFLKDGEYKLISDCCFGEDFYLHLLADLKEVEEYDDCKGYTTGDLVIFGALAYEADSDTTPGQSPESDPTLWIETSKFNSPDYAELYSYYLRDLLSFCVLHASLISTAIRVETLGVMKNSSDYSESAEDKTILLLKEDIQNRIETRRALLDKYLTRVNESLGINNRERFPLYPANVEYLCGEGCNDRKYKDSVNIPFLKTRNKRNDCKEC